MAKGISARAAPALAIAISEPGAGAHPKHLASTARREGDAWRLAGEKAYVTNGPSPPLSSCWR